VLARRDGVRITFIAGAPALFSECLKNICHVKKLPFHRVLHPPMGPNGDEQDYLYELTAQRSVPTMLPPSDIEDVRPRNVWLEQLMLAEELGEGVALVPNDMSTRVQMFGLLNEVLGIGGFIWNKRHMLNPEPSAFATKYGWSAEALAAAPRRVVEVLELMDGLLEANAPSKYLLGGDSITALDVYWATAIYIVAFPPESIMPTTDMTSRFRAMFTQSNTPEITAAVTDRLIAHRDYIVTTYCECPIVN
jgi:glutathione S-transferase